MRHHIFLNTGDYTSQTSSIFVHRITHLSYEFVLLNVFFSDNSQHVFLWLQRLYQNVIFQMYIHQNLLQSIFGLPRQSAPNHLNNKNTHVGILFIDCSSAFNTMISNKLISKLPDFGLGSSIYSWLLDFLTGES